MKNYITLKTLFYLKNNINVYVSAYYSIKIVEGEIIDKGEITLYIPLPRYPVDFYLIIIPSYIYIYTCA